MMSDKKQSWQVLGQFIKDLSFENFAARAGKESSESPRLEVSINVDGSKRTQPNQYNSSIKISVMAKDIKKDDTIFFIELDYGGIFQIENLPTDMIQPFLMIECPRLLYPFVRRIIHDITSDGGYPPISLDAVDFRHMYETEMARLAKIEKIN